MVVVMTSEATQDELDAVVRTVEAAGGEAFVSRGVHRTIVGLVGDIEQFEVLNLDALPGVNNVVRISSAYKLVSRENHPETSTVKVAGVPIGPETFTLIAGPCAVETAEQTIAAAHMAKSAGAGLLRGGAFKPRTSPFAFKGLGRAGLEILAEARAETGLPVVTELLDTQHAEAIGEHADVVQIGARNMQNYALLEVAGKMGKPVLLKRGLSSSLDELLQAADYILKEGNEAVVLCERGIRTFETATRFTLDLGAVPWLKLHTHLPVIVDPSHAAGDRRLVEPLSRAAAAVGADGIIVEVHQDPDAALCDGPQALSTSHFPDYARDVAAHAALLGKRLA
jgi:3-deoxy-7-phosphoheptulonate synthase